MFLPRPDSELTQVEFWNLYKDAFTPMPEGYPEAAAASEVIKNVNSVFPQAQAMVLYDPGQRFVIRGVGRRKDPVVAEPFKCQWNRSECPSPGFESLSALFEHALGHAAAEDGLQCRCLWSTCNHPPVPKSVLRAHILTHLARPKGVDKHHSQSDTITLSSYASSYPISDPTTRPFPPIANVTISYTEAANKEPPSTALTALLCIRFLFRAAFASQEVAPRADADHFGFPGVVEESDDGDDGGTIEDFEKEQEGERRGRKAFVGVRRLMEGVQIRDEVLMGWITEMVEAGLTGRLDSSELDLA